MNKDGEVLVFDIEGAYAHFRKGYTTTSPLTYDFPPRTALIGMLGAILGYDEDTYIENFSLEKCKIGIRILKPGRKIRLKENWREGPGGKAEMKNVSQVGLEVLRHPAYRIYLHCAEDGIINEIKDYLSKGESVFNPYLGIREFVCALKYNNIYRFEKLRPGNEFVEIVSIIPEKLQTPYSADDIDDSRIGEFILRRDIVPNETLKERKFKRIAVLYEVNGNPIYLRPKQDVIFIPDTNERFMFLE